ncbi:MAG: hypothetical protein ACYDB7_06670 [Mycobacteriales bacterium]
MSPAPPDPAPPDPAPPEPAPPDPAPPDPAPEVITDAEILWGVPAARDPRWPAFLAIVAALVLYLVLPARLSFGPRWLLPALEGTLLVPLVVSNPTHITRESRNLRWLSIALTCLIAAANSYSLARLASYLLYSGRAGGRTLIYSATLIWLTNVLVFGLWYWELDRGGPLARCQPTHRAADFLFPQMASPGVGERTWAPHFVDYLYVSATNATAFSPTDTMPLTPWAKTLMLLQSLVSLVTVGLVAARAVNILS